MLLLLTGPVGSDAIDFSLGCLTSFLLHESAHWIVGNSTGELIYKADQDGFPKWIYYGSDKGLFKTASAGILTDCLMREYYLLKRPNSDIWKGIFWYSIFHNLYYSFSDGGDIKALSEASGIRIGTFHTILAILTLADLYRYKNGNLNIGIFTKGLSLFYTITL